MKLILKLLGELNAGAPPAAPVRPKFIVRVTAEEIARHLQYDRRGRRKADPFRIRDTSLIRIDKEIQRGMDPAGFLSQQPTKVSEMVGILLGASNAAVPRIYMGTLVWNVRTTGSNSLQRIEMRRPNEPSEWHLEVSADAIYLTDSAHRHLAIAEAHRLWHQNSAQYPAFNPDFEFAVELYNLDRYGERELFFELNSKQKKISAAKAREVDVGSPIGALKDAIIQYDQIERRLLENNIEVSSNQNRQHTLLTMSVFVSSIAQMFTPGEIRAAWKEEDARAELAREYCEFLYKLSDTLVVRCDVDGDGVEEDVKPFRNLYADVIKPVFDDWDTSAPDKSQADVEKASQRAAELNRRLRERDIANSNATIRALFSIGGLVRHFPNWQKVVDRLQAALVAPSGGKFFQKENADLLATAEADVPIASLNQDGTLNVQVQSKTIARLTQYLREKLELTLPIEIVSFEQDCPQVLSSQQASVDWRLERAVENFKRLRLGFIGVRGQAAPDDAVKLAIKSPAWKAANATGKARLAPTAIEVDESWQHHVYEDLVRFVASFEVRLPVGAGAPADRCRLDLEFEYPEVDGTPLKVKISANCHVS